MLKQDVSFLTDVPIKVPKAKSGFLCVKVPAIGQPNRLSPLFEDV
ncbi:hypothetical protein LC040_04835 [Bacillus tianshenii]|nr:hypothetical protein LC040_04835 [Bacillus tianshenii]